MNQTLAGSISIVLNIHREGVFLPTTLDSLDAAVADVQARGVHVELVAVLDNPDEVTRQALNQYSLSRYDSKKILEVSNGSLGLSRNDGIAQATGEYIFLADADDLISTNYFTETLVAASKSTGKTIFFPEFLFAFGDNYHITHYSGLDRVGILAFLKHHPYISRACAHRSLFERLKFSDSRLSAGHAYEDWHFNCEALAAGYDIKAVDDIILFYRQRVGSLLRNADALSSRQIAPSELFVPSRFLQLNAAWEDRTKSSVPLEERSTHDARNITLARSDIQSEVERAGRLEPQIKLQKFEGVPFYFNHQHSLRVGQAYVEASKAIEDCQYSDIFFFPFLSKGGAEKFVLQVIDAIVMHNPATKVLLICGENYTGVSAESNLPANVTVLNLPLIDGQLSMEDRCLVTFKAIERSLNTTRLHFLSSVFGAMFIQRYSQLLKPFRCFFYRFNNTEKIENGRLVVTYSPFEFIEKYIDLFEKIICDSEIMLTRDTRQIPNHRDKWCLLHAAVPTAGQIHSGGKSGIVQPSELGWTERNEPTLDGLLDSKRLRVLWASRFDKQKRPELLPLIAKRIRDHSLSISIDAFGFSVFDNEAASSEQSDELSYRGPFKRFFDLPVGSYDVFLYTSWNDGVPNVLLEAGAAGIPVVAPAVGGIPEVVKDGTTGILLESLEDDAAMADAYVDALRRFIADRSLGKQLSTGLSAHLASCFSYAEHGRRVLEIFDIQPSSLDWDALRIQQSEFSKKLRRNYVLEKEWMTRHAARSTGQINADYFGQRSRAHDLADRYIQFASGNSVGAVAIRRLKAVVGPIWRRLRR